jgi:RNA polymerase sigma-70 factor, ECF subfamily
MDSAVAGIDWRQNVEGLYRADADRLWRAVYAYAADPDIASESVAEAYAQALRRGSAVRDPGAWIWRTAFRIAAGALKSRRAGDRLSARPAEHVDRYADLDLLDALHALPEAQRAAVILFYYADLPVSVIAHRLGSNALAVRANLSRGRRRLHALLGDDDD